MAERRDEPNPIDQLVDLLVYAPVGFLYEYQEVLPKLIKRGRSQVQLARVVGQMAVRGRADPADVVEVAASVAARALTELGAALGLPVEESSTGRGPTDESRGRTAGRTTDRPSASPSLAEAHGAGATTGGADEGSPAPMPIANYDALTAREIIALVPNLSAEQRSAVRAHELAGRARKTVLAKLDQLDG